MIDWLKDKIKTFKDYGSPRLILTHPLRTFFFSLLVAPLLLFFALCGLLGIITLCINPILLLGKIENLSFSDSVSLLKILFLWILGILFSITAFYYSFAGLLLYCMARVFH